MGALEVGGVAGVGENTELASWNGVRESSSDVDGKDAVVFAPQDEGALVDVPRTPGDGLALGARHVGDLSRNFLEIFDLRSKSWKTHILDLFGDSLVIHIILGEFIAFSANRLYPLLINCSYL